MALVIDVLRHGQALPSSPAGDEDRALSPGGIRQIRALGAALAARGWRPDRVFSSPLRRALESARFVIEGLADPPAIETLTSLHPGSEPEDVLDALALEHAADGHLVLVSHMPLVSRLCSHLCRETPTFHTGDMARVECPAGLVARGARLVPFGSSRDST